MGLVETLARVEAQVVLLGNRTERDGALFQVGVAFQTGDPDRPRRGARGCFDAHPHGTDADRAGTMLMVTS